VNIRDYMSSRQADLLNYLRKASAIIEHDGERGRNLETEVGRLIGEYLPGIFAVDTGFVRSLEDPDWQSNQIDLLLTRSDFGHPLAVFPETKVYPIEAVVGFVEVTKRVDKRKLEEDFRKVRDLKQKTQRTYVLPYSFAKTMRMPGTEAPPDPSDMLKKVYATFTDLEPRFFYFAFESDWTEATSLCRVLQETGEEMGVHCHGLFVPEFGFFMHKAVFEPPSRHAVKYLTAMPDAFTAFLSQILEALQSFTVIPSNAAIPLDRYTVTSSQFRDWDFLEG